MGSSAVRYSWEYDDAEHPRPPEVQLLEQFLNTVDEHAFGEHAAKPPERRDLFASVGDLQRWLEHHRLLVADEVVGARDLQRIRRLRSGVREWLRARAGLDHDAQRIEDAQVLAQGLRLRVQFGSRIALRASGQGLDAVMGRLLGDLAVAQATGTLDRLKICAADDCRFVYYDHSRSRTSRWCSMRTCGNRVKTRAYRRRSTRTRT